MPPRRLQNRSQIASKWLPEACRAPPKSGIDDCTKTLKTLVCSMVFDGFGPPRGVPNRAQMAPKSLLPASWQLLTLTGRFWALSWRLWAASWRSWGLLGASWGALVAILAPRENLAIMEREARSQRELQALQAANNKAAKHQESVLVKLCVLVKLRGRAPRPRSASWRGVAWNASRAGGRNRSLETKEKSLKRLQNATPEAPKSLPNRFKMAPGGLPSPPQERKR